MLLILSQKIDSESTYEDELFTSYHYPARYKNQLHEGDTFIYYQGNRFDKSQRYYFGVGTIGEINTTDGENYYAKLLDCQKFEKKVPIYLPDGGYIEQLGYDTVRNKSNPPWQSSVRPLSQAAFDHILKAAGIQTAPSATEANSVDELKEKLKQSIREFFVENDFSAIRRIESISAAIGRGIFGEENQEIIDEMNPVYQTDESSRIRLEELLEYCQTMKMSYSYKPVLILALLYVGDKNGELAIDEAARYFRSYYNERRTKGFPVEKKNCIYQRADITEQQIAGNVRANPVRALVESGFFFYDEETDVFSLDPAIWNIIDIEAREAIIQICHQKLDKYFFA